MPKRSAFGDSLRSCQKGQRASVTWIFRWNAGQSAPVPHSLYPDSFIKASADAIYAGKGTKDARDLMSATFWSCLIPGRKRAVAPVAGPGSSGRTVASYIRAKTGSKFDQVAADPAGWYKATPSVRGCASFLRHPFFGKPLI